MTASENTHLIIIALLSRVCCRYEFLQNFFEYGCVVVLLLQPLAHGTSLLQQYSLYGLLMMLVVSVRCELADADDTHDPLLDETQRGGGGVKSRVLAVPVDHIKKKRTNG